MFRALNVALGFLLCGSFTSAFANEWHDYAVARAQAQIGDDYFSGMEGPDLFDCSGLTQYAYRHVGIQLHRAVSCDTQPPERPCTVAQVDQGEYVLQRSFDANGEVADIDVSKLQPGDLLFFGNTKAEANNSLEGHVGLYVGGTTFINAYWGETVKEEDFTAPRYNSNNDPWYWKNHFIAAKRLTPSAPSTKFAIDDTVEATEDGANIRDAAADWNPVKVAGENATTSAGVKGRVMSLPMYFIGHWFWEVDFESGADGWVAEDYLQTVVPSLTMRTDTATALSGVATEIDVLANDEPDTLTITSTTPGAHGSVDISNNGVRDTVTYTSEPGYVGEDMFTYSVASPDGGIGEATVTVTVTAAPIGNTIELTPSMDIWTTSVYSYDPDTHFDGIGGGLNDERLQVGGWGDWYYSLVQFDLSGISTPATSATLRLYNTVSPASSASPVSMYLDLVTSDWDWTTQPLGPLALDNERLWWVNRPSYTTFYGPLAAPEKSSYWETDVTDLVNGHISGTYENFGMQLRPTSNWNDFNVFGSSENATSEWRPKLIIELPDAGAVVLEDFESYPLGSINGQSNGVVSWTDNRQPPMQVTSLQSYDGSKSLLLDDASNIVTANFIATTSRTGISRFSYWLRFDNYGPAQGYNDTQTWDQLVVGNGVQAQPLFFNVCRYSETQVSLLFPGGAVGNDNCVGGVGSLNIGSWGQVMVEIDWDNSTARARLNGSIWSDFVSIQSSFDQIVYFTAWNVWSDEQIRYIDRIELNTP